MKKFLSYFALAAVCMGFASCEDGVEDSNTVAPVNPQEAIFDKANLTVAAPAASTFDLQALNDADQACALTTVSATNVPEGYNVEMVFEMSSDDTFGNALTTNVEIADGTVTVPADVLNGLYKQITKDPAVGTVYVRYAAYIVNGTAKVRVGGPDYYVGEGTISVKPFAPEKVIEDTYYLIGTASNGQITGGLKLNHSSKSQYDDPKFTITVEISSDEAANGYQWAVVPASTVAAGSGLVYGTEEPDYSDGKGTLVEAADADFNYGAVYEEGPYSFTFNMETLEFDNMLAIPQLYTPGNTNGWNQSASQVLTTDDFINYRGYAHLNGEFKFSTQPNWNGVNLGNANEEGMLSNDGGAGNLNAATDGLYWLTVNYPELTYTMSLIETLGVIGGMNDWGAQVNLTPGADFLVWTGDVEMKAGQEFKFRANDNWDINLGEAEDNLKYNGANLTTDKLSGWAGDGTYTVTLDLSAVPYTMTIVKK